MKPRHAENDRSFEILAVFEEHLEKLLAETDGVIYPVDMIPKGCGQQPGMQTLGVKPT
jgi:hypothetical protein